MLTRRRFLAGTLLTVVGPAGSATQQGGKIPRVGYLDGASPNANPALLEAFRDGLRELGYLEGRNVGIEYRWAEGRYERLPALAAELVKIPVDVIVCVGDPVILAARQATSTIPIVMASVGDPLGRGFVSSLARPGGNITGVSNFAVALSGKWLEILREALPKLSHVALLRNADNPTHAQFWTEAQRAARDLGLNVQSVEVHGADEIDAAVASLLRAHAGAFIVLPDPLLTGLRARIAELAARGHVPWIGAFRETAQVGALMAYGPSLAANRRRAAVFVDKILKGAKPADLPVEQPTKFEFLINLKAARTLGVTMPPSLLARADEVIQ